MTVAELIAVLQAEDPDTDVVIGYEGTFGPFEQICRHDERWTTPFVGSTPVLKHGKLVVVATR